jgi:hypothetical protein
MSVLMLIGALPRSSGLSNTVAWLIPYLRGEQPPSKDVEANPLGEFTSLLLLP